MSSTRYWVWIFGEIEGLRWVLDKQRMAFAAHAAVRVGRMSPGDKAVLFVTRGAFHNPNRDESRLAGIVEVSSAVGKKRAVTIAGRKFDTYVDFLPRRILPEREGPPVKTLVHDLERVKRADAWGHYFRNSPIEISRADFMILARAIRAWKSVR